MIKNPYIIEYYNKETQNWIRVNMQNLEPGDIVRILNASGKLRKVENCTILLVQELPNFPVIGMEDKTFAAYLED